MHVDRERVACMWLYRGLCDIYFAFTCDDDKFEDYERFMEIMALEKFLKALLLYHESIEKPQSLPNPAEQRIALNALSKKLGHNFEKMAVCASKKGAKDIPQILQTNYDGYVGGQLLAVFRDAYMETRYPVSVPVSDKFPLDDGFTHDPLGSSGIPKFIYAMCNSCLCALAAQNVNVQKVVDDFCIRFRPHKPFSRFERLFWEGRSLVVLGKEAV